jgi:hypothetical protein
MKSSKTMRLIAMSILAAFVGACVPPTKPGTGPSTMSFISKNDIKLKIKNGVLEIDERENPNCPTSSHKKGCVVVAAGESAQLDFKLHEQHMHLSRLQLCEGIDQPSNWADCELRPDQIAEFVATDGVTVVWANEQGVFDLKKISTDLHTFQLRDFNWQEGDFFYRIEACPDDEDDASLTCLWADPPIRNKGK